MGSHSSQMQSPPAVRLHGLEESEKWELKVMTKGRIPEPREQLTWDSGLQEGMTLREFCSGGWSQWCLASRKGFFMVRVWGFRVSLSSMPCAEVSCPFSSFVRKGLT